MSPNLGYSEVQKYFFTLSIRYCFRSVFLKVRFGSGQNCNEMDSLIPHGSAFILFPGSGSFLLLNACTVI